MKSLMKNLVRNLLRNFELDIRNSRFAYTSALEDIVRILETVEQPVIFDVGANRGDTVATYKKLLPNATIYAFEPTPELIDILTKRFFGCPDITIVPEALSDTEGMITFYLMSNNVINSMSPLHGKDGEYYGVRERQEIEVKTRTGSEYCIENKISKIDFLKLDIQGAEKRALAGLKSMIETAQISVIYLELTFVPIYETQTTFGEIETFMNSYGYHLYGFYDFNRESNGCLDHCDVLYISPKTYEKINPHYLF
jgi:FkbM family methyltransferase